MPLVIYPWVTNTPEDTNNSGRVASTEFVNNNSNKIKKEILGNVGSDRDTLSELSKAIDDVSDTTLENAIALSIALG